ncbi:Oidioi.mRNA.OKI2018_I69.PAR.g11474.t1.cds [Oikopleura dioica]|uniref:Oidioi.mRNA.OKI2018_I69.PAR.g11474.t1.cds n=1 Tax=Oikopleura dioica TaxID=34765 RepID=A0ABN7RYV7_OIKDI|nr:Oidioi.mRNA.OKI2018_I69.PAR.g11474.t1.cds [Oikopleura dioica]
MAEIFLSDDLNDSDRFEELESIREKLIAAGADVNPIEGKNLGASVASVFVPKNFAPLWAEKVSENDVLQVTKQSSIFIGLLMDFQSPGEIEDCNKITKSFCDAMLEGEKAGRGKIVCRILYDMFKMAFPVKSKAMYLIYCTWLQCASRKNSIYLLELEGSKIERFLEKWAKDWNITELEIRVLRREYQACLHRLGRYQNAASAMEDLLNSYSDADITGEEARADARLCILQSICTEGEYRFDHLREIDAIQAHKGTSVYEFLEIFITGDLAAFEKFVEGSDISEFALDEEKLNTLRRKMRLLTLVGLCKSNPDTTYKAIQDKLGLDEDGVEDLAVRAFQLKLLRGRLDQGNERLSTTYSIQREFGRAEWEDLAEKLSSWQNNLENVRLSIEEVQNLELAA